ncbi:MAG: hypothetical protein NPIRA02_09290 [Nitrospirales bacterium]|nr:MAG: hypothetical protein NPIRA02_09290 [Nitrospirales bacterium]
MYSIQDPRVNTLNTIWRQVFWVVFVLLLLEGCSTVGVSRPVPSPGVALFDQALMAYAQGELMQAAELLYQVEPTDVRDLRAQDLLDAIHQERGDSTDEEDPLRNTDISSSFSSMSPEQLLKIVEYQNPEIRQALFRVIAARAELREANVSFTPEFSVLTRFIPSGIFVRLTQSIIDGIVKRAERMSQAEEDLIAAIAQYSDVRAAVLRRAASEYLTLLNAEGLLPLKESALVLALESKRVGALLVNHGRQSPRDIPRLRDHVLDLREEIATIKSRRSIAHYTLKSVMGQTGTSDVAYEHKSLVVDTPGQIEEVIQSVNEQHPQLVQALAHIQQAYATKRETFWSLPRVDLQGSYGAGGSGRRGGFFQGFTLGARISAPLLIWPLQRARSDREQAFIDVLEMEWSRLQGEITVNVVTAYEDLRSAHATLKWIRAEKTHRQQELHILEEQERLGKAKDRLTLLEARMNYLKTVEQEATQHLAIQQATLDLRYSSGLSLQGMEFLPVKESSNMRILPSAPPTALFDRALWVWQPDFLDNREQRKFFLDFVKLRNIQTIFLSVSKNRIHDASDLYKPFITQAHQNGLHVHALNGDPSWVLPEGRQAAHEFIQGIVHYNQQHDDARFDAIHLDVEPYTLPEWDTSDRQALIMQYVDFFDWAHHMTASAALPLVVDIPSWLDKESYENGTLMEAVWSRVDDVAVMAYHDHPRKIVKALQDEIGYAKRHQKRLWVGVSADPRHIATSDDVDRSMEFQWQGLGEHIHTQLSGEVESFGIAIHDYRRYQRLLLSEALVAL